MRKVWFSRMLILVVCCSLGVIAMAEKRADGFSGIVTEAGAWYNAPWVWVSGAALFLMALVVILRIGTRRVDV